MTGTYANIMKMLCGKKKITLKVRSVISSFMRNDILKYHIEQGEEKRCYRNSLIQNQIFTTLQQQMKKSTLKVVMFVCLFVCFVTRWHALIYAPNNVSWEHYIEYLAHKNVALKTILHWETKNALIVLGVLCTFSATEDYLC